MTALIRMRLARLVRTGLALAPVLAALALLGVLYGGGRARPAEAYGVSAVLLFPVLAWQTKILLDAEPDGQRLIAGVALMSRTREVAAGVLAAMLAAVPVALAGLALPWLVGGVTLATGGPGLGPALALGIWAHAVVAPVAVGLGGLSSRAVAGSPGRGTAVLVGGVVLALVLGGRAAALPWLAPPLLAVARALAGRQVNVLAVVPLTGWALGWAVLLLGGYGWLRRRRA